MGIIKQESGCLLSRVTADECIDADFPFVVIEIDTPSKKHPNHKELTYFKVQLKGLITCKYCDADEIDIPIANGECLNCYNRAVGDEQ